MCVLGGGGANLNNLEILNVKTQAYVFRVLFRFVPFFAQIVSEHGDGCFYSSVLIRGVAGREGMYRRDHDGHPNNFTVCTSFETGMSWKSLHSI